MSRRRILEDPNQPPTQLMGKALHLSSSPSNLRCARSHHRQILIPWRRFPPPDGCPLPRFRRGKSRRSSHPDPVSLEAQSLMSNFLSASLVPKPPHRVRMRQRIPRAAESPVDSQPCPGPERAPHHPDALVLFPGDVISEDSPQLPEERFVAGHNLAREADEQPVDTFAGSAEDRAEQLSARLRTQPSIRQGKRTAAHLKPVSILPSRYLKRKS